MAVHELPQMDVILEGPSERDADLLEPIGSCHESGFVHAGARMGSEPHLLNMRPSSESFRQLD